MKEKSGALSPQRTEELLGSLQDIFVVEGFRRVTMADLAERLHCSKATLYCLADSKEALFILVLVRNLDEIWERGLQAEQLATDPTNRIHQYIVAALVPIRKWSPAFLSDVQRLPAAKKLLNEHLDQRMKRLEQMVLDGIDSGVFRGVNPTLIAGLVYSSALYFCSPEFLESADLSLTEAVQQLCAVVWHGLMVDDEEPAPTEVDQIVQLEK
jgi:AcrR family transcriptional regulator